MSRDIAKGLPILALAVCAVCALFPLIADSGPDKAACIARALRAGVAVGNIERVCNLLA